MKRFFLFLLTNILVVVTISIVLSLLGVSRNIRPGDYQALLVFCFSWGMVGSLVSLAISRWSAKMFMGVQVIDPNNPGQHAGLVQMVHRLAMAANLPKVPEVGVYDSSEINAFATGPSKRRSLVAFSSGLLSQMGRDEIEGVAGHEIGHIANGDMVTMSLIQGVINSFVMFISRILAFALSASGSRDDNSRPSAMAYMLVPLFEILFGILGMIVVCWFSRKREFRADRASAGYAGKAKMVRALKGLQSAHENPYFAPQGTANVAAMKISGRSGFAALFSTHPTLEERIAALEAV